MTEAGRHGPARHGLLQLSVDLAVEPSLAVDPDGLVVAANAAARAFFGWPAGGEVGSSRPVRAPDALLAVIGEDPSGLADGGAQRVVELRRADGADVWVQCSLRRPDVSLLGGGHVVVTVGDTGPTPGGSSYTELRRLVDTTSQMNAAAIRAGSVAQLLGEVCEVAVRYGEYVTAFALEHAGGTRIALAATSGRTEGLAGFAAAFEVPLSDDGHPHAGTAIARAFRERVPTYVTDLDSLRTADPFRAALAAAGVVQVAVLPLTHGDGVPAVVVLLSTEPTAFAVTVRSGLEQLMETMTFTWAVIERQHQLDALIQERRKVLERLATGEEAERERIARTIRSDSVQRLTAAALRMDLFAGALERAAPALAESIDTLTRQLAAATRRLRDLSFELDPAATTHTLCSALVRTACSALLDAGAGFALVEEGHRELVRMAPRTGDAPAGVLGLVDQLAEPEFEGWDLVYGADPDEVGVGEHMAREQRAALLLVLREALINVRKHASATWVTCRVRATGDGVEVQVTDDGKGITPALSQAPGHRGLPTMRDRATAAGGWCAVESQPGAGTTVTVWLPDVLVP